MVVMASVLPALPAHADSDDDQITHMAIRADVGVDGSAMVTLDFDFNFGDDSGHGPYLTFPERMAIQDDPDHWRSLPISEITASSPTAPTDLDIDRDSGAVQVKFGDSDVDLEGTHTYQVSYRIAGVINPATSAGLDEFSWNPIGTEWEVPLHDVTVTVTMPTDIVRVGCFAGEKYDTDCSPAPTSSARTATFGSFDLTPGQGLQVVTGVPAGSFPGVAPILVHRSTVGNTLGVNPVSLGLAAAVLGGGSAVAALVARRRPRPAPATTAVAVRETPPEGVPPGLVGVLADEKADNDDVAATLLDLAVRGHLHVEQGESSGPILVRAQPAPPDDGLLPFERALLDGIFSATPRVDLGDTDSDISAAAAACRQEMDSEVARRGWFPVSPMKTRTRWLLAGLLIGLVGIATTVVFSMFLGLGFIGLALVGVGVVVCCLSGVAVAPTPAGTEIQAQAEGFRQYLSTSDADTLALPPGVDLFSLYLPWTVLWGLTEHWSSIFAALAAKGTVLSAPVWYPGLTPQMWRQNGSGLLDGIQGLSHAATSSMTAATSSSSGSSGFSGGGGVGGGGGGGW